MEEGESMTFCGDMNTIVDHIDCDDYRVNTGKVTDRNNICRNCCKYYVSDFSKIPMCYLFYEGLFK